MWTFLRHFRSSSSNRLCVAGFTIIELVVVVGVMAVITTTLLFRQQSFNSSTLLRSFAYSVALSVRQAQTYGISVLGVSGSFAAQSYGIHLQGPTLSTDACPHSTSYVLFADTANKGYYDSSATAVRTFSISKGFYISNAAVQRKDTVNGNVVYDCMCQTPTIQLGGGVTATCANYPRGNFDIMFHRPNPDACFAVQNTTDLSPQFPNGTCAIGSGRSDYPAGVIQVTSQGGTSRVIRVNTTGEIEVSSAGS